MAAWAPAIVRAALKGMDDSASQASPDTQRRVFNSFPDVLAPYMIEAISSDTMANADIMVRAPPKIP
jgi:hypothetical protein